MLDALFSARGRMRRRDWWLWAIGVTIALSLAGLLVHLWFGTSTLAVERAQLGRGPLTPFGGWIIFTNTLAYWPYVCLTAKRWHDRNRSGWLAAIWPALAIPLFAVQHLSGLAGDATARFGFGALQGGLGLAVGLVFIWILIDCGILDGTPGENRYGPSPKGLGVKAEDVF